MKFFRTYKKKAYQKARLIYKDRVYIRGLIEISNYCKQDCYYCGIRASNHKVERYRYDVATILEIIDRGYQKGYRTFVMQGGEDDYYTDEKIVTIIESVKAKYSDVAITLSLGIKDEHSYNSYKKAGANRYLMRHESASPSLFSKLHPLEMNLKQRMDSLRKLKDLDYQTGAGFMVGSPSQTNQDLVKDLFFIQSFSPEMIGIGPYLSHPDTPFANETNGRLEHVLVCYALARLLCPLALIPSTTATSSLDKQGRLKALKSGCNVIMINLSLEDTRIKYTLYANKTYLGDESDQYVKQVENDINEAGLKIDFSRGDHIKREED